MTRRITLFILTFIIWTLSGIASKLIFLSVHHSFIGTTDIVDWCAVISHGIILDIAIAGYLTIIPGLLLIISLWYQGKVLTWTIRLYFLITAFLTALAYVANTGLYGFWGFPLDNTPLLYIKTSPSDALASMTALQTAVASISLLLITALQYLVFESGVIRNIFSQRDNCQASYEKGMTSPVDNYSQPSGGGAHHGWSRFFISVALLLLTASLIIPIRGGFGTGTNHTGTVYYSTNTRLNHAAVNPVFSFIESVLHQQDIGNQYRFMDDVTATKLFKSMIFTEHRSDSAAVRLLRQKDVNVVIVMLESFSKYIMAEGGHVKGVTPRLDRFSREGIYFNNIYTSSTRTDRAIVAILSGLPAQPSMSIMDMPNKSTTLPSIARTLGRIGYDTHFYYGGDTNYSNMRSYLVGTGFQHVTEDCDFPVTAKRSKWGMPDGPVYERILTDIIREQSNGKPLLKVMMTESSHEPFDVPYNSGLKEEELNAFAYADHCLGVFIDQLRQQPSWKNTLVVIVPDHMGAWPRDIDNYQLWRYETPLIMLGGVVERPQQVNTLGSQTDIPATLLTLLGHRHDNFLFSKDLLDSRTPRFAFFSFSDVMGIVTDSCAVIYDDIARKTIPLQGSDITATEQKGKAYLQKLYDYIEAR